MDEMTAEEWAGFGAHMPPPLPGTTPTQLQERNKQMLLRALNMRTTVAVIGSGCSIDLGYPSWVAFASKVIACTREAAPTKYQPNLERFASQLPKNDKDETGVATDLLMYYIGACIEILQHINKLDTYHDHIREWFKLCDKQPNTKYNQYRAIVTLPITRFVTTNFDCEIERALEQCNKVPPGTFLSGGEIRADAATSFHQRSDNFDAFARFALAGLRENRYNVFHCHGRYDEPASVVASERNYQDTYLADNDNSSAAFRQSIEMLLGSNPLLFVGYGLRDDDLLRPLRYLGAVDPQRKQARPIFALLQKRSEQDSDRHAMLFERYGLKVLPFQVEGDEGVSAAACRQLQELHTSLQEGWKEWLKKPRLRKPLSAAIKKDGQPFLAMKATQVPIREVTGLHEQAHKPGVICLEGPSGVGKSWHCWQLMQHLQKSKRLKGWFYWNLHYGNDLLSGLDTMLAYFDPKGGAGESRITRFERCLQQPNLLILDGCERVLRKTDDTARALPYSARFRKLLNALLATQIESTVILAGRAMPSVIDAPRQGASTDVRVFRIPRLRSGDLRQFGCFKEFPEQDWDQVTALCEVLRGHNYGLLMANHLLTLAADDLAGKQKELDRLTHGLAQRPADRRLHEMVHRLLSELDGSHQAVATPFLRRLALFLSPISDDTLRICYNQALESLGLAEPSRSACASGPEPPELAALKGKLCACGFLFSVERRDRSCAYWVHATARRQLFETIHGQAADALPDFGLSGPLSGRVGIDPGKEGKADVGNLYAALLECADTAITESRFPEARRLCRDAFGLIRGRMEANTASRWCDFEEYARFAIRTAVLAKRAAPAPAWTYAELPTDVDSVDGPLHLGELAWLYNDAAMSLYYLGHLRDAYSIWEQTWEIGKLAGHPSEPGSLQIEVRLSLVSCFIEMGRLPAARRILEELASSTAALGKDEVTARVVGLRALIHHLQGNLPQADRLYLDCLSALAGNNLRAESYFEKQHADLKISMGDLGAAEQLIRASRAHAEAAVFPDLVLFARATEAHLLVRHDKIAAALVEYRVLLHEAQMLKLRRNEAEIEFSMARCALRQGDAESARQLAINSLRIANEHGLGLRLTHSLAVLGMAMLKTGGSGHRRMGIAYLRQAEILAHEQEYWHRGREAQRILQDLGRE